MKGRLQDYLSFVKPITILFEFGYVLPGYSKPSQFSQNKRVSALQNNEFVQKYIQELDDIDCVEAGAHAPYICSPLSVVENSLGTKINLQNIHT